MINPMMGNMMQLLQQIKSNPVEFLMQRQLRLPKSVSANDPQAILNHLLQSGQVSQSAINNAYQMLSNLRG